MTARLSPADQLATLRAMAGRTTTGTVVEYDDRAEDRNDDDASGRDDWLAAKAEARETTWRETQ